jgi:hypothetical protein
MISPNRKFHLIFICFFIFSLLISISAVAQSTGEIEMLAFNFKGNGVRALAMGGAYIAVGGDPSAAFWNPAGLASITESQIAVAYNFSGKIARTYSESNSDTLSITGFDFPLDFSGIDYIALTLPLKQEDLYMVHQVSYSLVHNFGFSGSVSAPYTLTNDVISLARNTSFEGSGAMQEISYAVGFRAFKIIQVGAAYHHFFGAYNNTGSDLYSSESMQITENIDSTANWDFLGDNFSIGIIVKPTNFLNIGGVFKTNYELKAKYGMEQTYSYSDPVSNISSTYSSDGEALIKHPSEWGFGVSVIPMKNLIIAADYTYSNWLADQNEDGDYIRGTIVDFNFPYDPENPPVDTESLNYPTFTRPEDYNQEAESYLRFGGEYIWDSKNFDIAVRAGFWQHTSIFTDSNAESIKWTGITAGAGLTLSSIKLDVALILESASYPSFIFSSEAPTLDISNTYLLAQVSYIFESF